MTADRHALEIAGLATILGAGSYLAHRIGWYGIWWWDVLGHALGGTAVAGLAFAAWSYAGLSGRRHDLATVATTVAVALCWEVYEYFWWHEAGKFTRLRWYYEDTTLDVGIAVIGALVLVVATIRYRRR